MIEKNVSEKIVKHLLNAHQNRDFFGQNARENQSLI